MSGLNKVLLFVVLPILVGVLANALSGKALRKARRLRARLGYGKHLSYNATTDELFMVGSWSPVRPLDSNRLKTDFITRDERPHQLLIAADLLRETVASRIHDTGATVYMTGFRLDHRESDATQNCYVRLAPSEYSEVRAIEFLRIHSPAALLAADSAVAADARSYLSQAVPSSLAVNVIVLTDSQEVLCAKRSSAVDNGVGIWTIGIFETMKQADVSNPGRREDFYALIERALEEELGLRREDYGPIHITWLGIYRPIHRGHLVAIVVPRIGADEIVSRAQAADSSYEHVAFKWMPLTKKNIEQYITAPHVCESHLAGSTIVVESDQWIEQSRLALTETWRYRGWLGNA